VDSTDPRRIGTVAPYGGESVVLCGLYLFDPANGHLSLDHRFHDPGSTDPGILLTGTNWPRGYDGNVIPHGAVLSR